MKFDFNSTPAKSDRSLQSAAAESKESSLQTEESRTVSFNGDGDPAGRVIPQIDALAHSLQNAHQGGDEECLESYLEQYMLRLTGKPQKEVAAASLERPVEAAAPVVSEEAPERLPTPAPEQRDQLTAMRALANESARRAVESSNVTRIVSMRRAFFEAKGASIASTTLAIAFFATHSTIALASAALLFVAAVGLSYRFFRLTTARC